VACGRRPPADAGGRPAAALLGGVRGRRHRQHPDHRGRVSELAQPSRPQQPAHQSVRVRPAGHVPQRPRLRPHRPQHPLPGLTGGLRGRCHRVSPVGLPLHLLHPVHAGRRQHLFTHDALPGQVKFPTHNQRFLFAFWNEMKQVFF